MCIVDVSQLRGGPSLILSGLILRRIFDRNQEEFQRASDDAWNRVLDFIARHAG